VLNATGFSRGQFTVEIPNPVEGGEYRCQVANPQVTCLDASAPLLQAAPVTVDGCHAQLTVTSAMLAKVRVGIAHRHLIL
jgi:hypothetical protein